MARLLGSQSSAEPALIRGQYVLNYHRYQGLGEILYAYSLTES